MSTVFAGGAYCIDEVFELEMGSSMMFILSFFFLSKKILFFSGRKKLLKSGQFQLSLQPSPELQVSLLPCDVLPSITYFNPMKLVDQTGHLMFLVPVSVPSLLFSVLCMIWRNSVAQMNRSVSAASPRNPAQWKPCNNTLQCNSEDESNLLAEKLSRVCSTLQLCQFTAHNKKANKKKCT